MEYFSLFHLVLMFLYFLFLFETAPEAFDPAYHVHGHTAYTFSNFLPHLHDIVRYNT